MTTFKVEGDRDLQVRSGEEVTLEVPGANTTGYLWRLEANPEDVEIVDHQVLPNTESFGGAGIERFTVKSTRDGDSTLKLELKRPWGPDDIAESHTVQLKASPRE
ncbi:MAG: Chagasin family peptidase inhibitor [Variibacter sp.]|jgi:predicted secreted protein|nr:Chagasin family peptidase inhibitor [Variibacter sp.]